MFCLSRPESRYRCSCQRARHGGFKELVMAIRVCHVEASRQTALRTKWGLRAPGNDYRYVSRGLDIGRRADARVICSTNGLRNESTKGLTWLKHWSSSSFPGLSAPARKSQADQMVRDLARSTSNMKHRPARSAPSAASSGCPRPSSTTRHARAYPVWLYTPLT
ncbi:unnamed protein product [Hyaloperonospora brassicae]|uniref:RxLR effector candidate protein n=1 Tax=Hyaloperonospora brassicae TaxID=162125 RepID=A0AAV0TSH0_HYABA|nr:unnamed protein product [Hyaloperonospora brassicae]